MSFSIILGFDSQPVWKVSEQTLEKETIVMLKGVVAFAALLILYSVGGTVLGLLLSGNLNGLSDPKSILPEFNCAIGTALLILISFPTVSRMIKKGS